MYFTLKFQNSASLKLKRYNQKKSQTFDDVGANKFKIVYGDGNYYIGSTFYDRLEINGAVIKLQQMAQITEGGGGGISSEATVSYMPF